MTSPLTDQRLDDIDTRLAAALHCPNAAANGRLDGQHTLTGSFTNVRCELCGHSRPGGERVEETAALVATVRRLQQQCRFLLGQIAKKDAAMSGDGDRALAEFLGGEPAAGPDIAAADNPTPLRWDLNDVLWGDDDTVTVLLSGPNSEPYWLELDPERAAVLCEVLTGPDGEEVRAEPEPSTRPCGHDDYHDSHPWHDHPHIWCPGHRLDAPVSG